MRKKCIIATIGCRLNQADSALIAFRLKEQGYEIKEEKCAGDIDLVVINGCTVTHNAAAKTRNAVRRLKKKYPEALIIATGCMTEKDKRYYVHNKYANVVIPNNLKSKIIEFVTNPSAFPQSIESEKIPSGFSENAYGYFPFRNRALVKIQEGCNAFCSYCIVPYMRGRERSRDPKEIISEVRHLIQSGIKEIVLTGTNICTYKYKTYDLPALISRILKLKGDFRVRLSSTEPHKNNFRIIDIMADNPKLCRFLHLPLQHGTDEILTRMNRKYTIKEFCHIINYARKKVKDIHIGSDIIVGFPGETDDLFEQSCIRIKQFEFANLHIFSYSKREGTPAASFPEHVPYNIMKKRYYCLSSLADKLKQNYLESFIGKSLRILTERINEDASAEGWSDNYLRVKILPKLTNNQKTLKINKFYDVIPEKIKSNILLSANLRT